MTMRARLAGESKKSGNLLYGLHYGRGVLHTWRRERKRRGSSALCLTGRAGPVASARAPGARAGRRVLSRPGTPRQQSESSATARHQPAAPMKGTQGCKANRAPATSAARAVAPSGPSSRRPGHARAGGSERCGRAGPPRPGLPPPRRRPRRHRGPRAARPSGGRICRREGRPTSVSTPPPGNAGRNGRPASPRGPTWQRKVPRTGSRTGRSAIPWHREGAGASSSKLRTRRSRAPRPHIP